MPLTNVALAVEMVNAVRPPKPFGFVRPVSTPLTRMPKPVLSIAQPPVMTIEERSRPVVSNVVRKT
jgi:hypothetical protein